jgi:peptide-methionine (S)-S-oxide reductase
LAVHVKFIIPICNQNGAPDEYQFVGAMPGHGSGAHSNERSHKAMPTQSSHVHRHALRTASTAFGLFLTVLGIAILFRLASPAAVELARPINPPPADLPNSTPSGTGRAVFAGGCFWGVQAVFQHTKGVTSAVSGYAGGTPAAPSYEQVSSGATGHAESVEITFDPKQISYGHLLQIYFSVAHDPTQLNRQDPDEGTQYRSEIFATSDAQQRAAEAYIAELDKAHAFAGRIVTKVERLKAFYPAEPYHQDYAALHPGSLYIAAYDLPKIANLKKLYPEFYREQAVLVGGDQQ